MFGNAESMEFHCCVCICIGESRFPNKIFVNSCNFLELVHVQFKDTFLKVIVTLGSIFYEATIFGTCRNDVVQHHVQEGDIGTRFQLEVISGIFSQFNFSGINDNALDSLH